MNINQAKIDEAKKIASEAMERYGAAIGNIAEKNFVRVLEAFREERVNVDHFHASTGYAYHDAGRDKLEDCYVQIFGAEAALVRQQMISGTHAISLALMGNLLPGDELLLVGTPYDTLQKVIGFKGPEPGTLREMGISYRVVDIDFENLDLEEIASSLKPETKIVSIQRSRGYIWRKSLSVEGIAAIATAIKKKRPEVIIFVDNCYGEMVQEIEPTHLGIDLMAGSLIKNAGAGLTPGGGYIVGKEELVERAAYRLTVPGAGRKMGATIMDNRLYYQALFMMPQVVEEAVRGAIFTAAFMPNLGFAVSPLPEEPRADIIQAVRMGNAKSLIDFCQGIQRYSPVDSYVSPEPWPMPGYDNDIIMASGAFVQGSSIELSADAPIREPYNLFIQGGLSRYHVKYALIKTIGDMCADEVL